MTIINSSQDREHPITPVFPLPDEMMHCHAANLFFNFCVARISLDEVVLTLASRTPMSSNVWGANNGGGARSTVGCVVDYAAHLVGWRALGSCHLKEYELSFYGDFTVEMLQVRARIIHSNLTHASFQCSIWISGNSEPRLFAEAHGTLVAG